ncbi:MAG: PEGA domain-containing protein, partial [Planctomycetes bacterium]|nr:PEGA domain-containing protein [Planctomycetota bacterium]
STNCDAEGNYEIALLTGVRYRVAAKHPNYAQMSATRQHNGEGTQNFVLNEGGYSLIVKIGELKVAEGEMPFVEVSLKDAQGQLHRPRGEPFLMPGLSNALTFSSLPSGVYTLHCPAGAYQAITKTINIGGEKTATVTLDLIAAATIEFSFSNANVSPMQITTAHATWENLSTGEKNSRVSVLDVIMNMGNPTKTYRVRGLSEGEWKITLEVPGFQPYVETYRVKAGETQKVTVQLAE